MLDLARLLGTAATPKTAARPAPTAPKASAPTQRMAPADGVDLRLSNEARALLDQIGAARGEQAASSRPARPGTRVNVVV